MDFFNQKWFKITCWVLLGLSVVGLAIGGITADSVMEFVNLIFSAIISIGAIIIFIITHIKTKTLKEVHEDILEEVKK